ncbi:MAG: hypothetical protein IK139_04040 [Lachnospiraceae bacterium]|nr:hypothetical protein [Lachnospiraceae bacterium]
MDTRKLYDEAPYDREFGATIIDMIKTDQGKTGLILDKTLFFPEEGGQSCDKGTLGGFEVTHVSIDNGIITHEIDAASDAFSKGSVINGVIDWKHRFSNMQNHTGEHILSGLLHRDFGSENMGFHLSDNIVTLDTTKVLTEDQLKELEQKANEAVYADLPVFCRYYTKDELGGIEYRSKLDLDDNIRLVVIPGVDICACCAPHVKHTGEIGLIKIIKAINYKGGMRLTILSGKRAYDHISEECRRVDDLTHILSEKRENLITAVERLLEKTESYRLEKIENAKRVLEGEMEKIDDSAEDAVIFVEEVNDITQRNAVNDLASKHSGLCGVFSGNDLDGYKYIISMPGGDARDASNILKEKLQAKGGGSKEMVQGSVNARKDIILEALNGRR